MCKWGDEVLMWLPRSRDPSSMKQWKVDRCIAPKIKELRAQGIETWGACCLHGKRHFATIAIANSSIQRALDLGYQMRRGSCPPVVIFPYSSLQGEDYEQK